MTRPRTPASMRLWMSETNEALKTLLEMPAAAVSRVKQMNPEGGSSPERRNDTPTSRYIRLMSRMRLTR